MQQQQFSLALTLFCAKDDNTGSAASQERRLKKKQAKDHIIKTMVDKKVSFIEHNGNYIILQEKLKPRKLCKEVVVRAFTEFSSNANLHGGAAVTKEQQAIRFGDYCTAVCKHLGSRTLNLTLTTIKPLQALVLENLQFPAAAAS